MNERGTRDQEELSSSVCCIAVSLACADVEVFKW